jgi:integrase
MVPNSRKGRHPKIERKPLPIPPALARALRTAAAGRPEGDPLLLRADGSRWRHIDLALFRKAVAAAGIDNPKLTPYCLRHSSIVRALLAGVPVRVVASSHDTSVAMIEKHYSDHISDHSDTIVRKAMLDLSAPAAVPLNVIPIVGRK